MIKQLKTENKMMQQQIENLQKEKSVIRPSISGKLQNLNEFI